VILESPRGAADAGLGASSDLVQTVDLVVLLGKVLDFSYFGHIFRLIKSTVSSLA
jgi:hypothetical protein